MDHNLKTIKHNILNIDQDSKTLNEQKDNMIKELKKKIDDISNKLVLKKDLQKVEKYMECFVKYEHMQSLRDEVLPVI